MIHWLFGMMEVMKMTRNLPRPTRRDAWVEVNLDALEKNVRHLRSVIRDDVKCMAIIKADAYGHGAVMVTPTLEASGIDMLGVASLDEALQLRESGTELPILVIGGVPDWSIQSAVENNIQLTIFDRHHLEGLKHLYEQTNKPVSVHIKVDTGMHRIGVDWREAASFITECQSLPCLNVVGVFSHFADPANKDLTQTQIERWESVLSALDKKPEFCHIANSQGMLLYPEVSGNLCRLGIALFGYSEGESASKLKPVMGLKARIIRLETVDAGTGVSYCHTHTTKAPAKIATVPIGYADGVFRNLSNQIEAMIHGHCVPQVGNITMDQMMFDVTSVPDIQVGETITLLGTDKDNAVSLTDWAGKAGTIEYELMCALRVRLPKTYIR